MNTLKINEIFYSIQGESIRCGLPTVFVRLTGCPLRCHYCDTAYAFHQGQRQSIESIIETIQHYPTQTVCVTGGEPLAQPAVLTLITQLCDLGYAVSIETSGAMDISTLDTRTMIIMDLKTPDSGEVDRNKWENIAHLKALDQLKIVICSEFDFQWACEQIKRYNLPSSIEWLFSPMTPGINPTQLAQWILDSGLPIRLQLQIHKILWHDTPGH